MEPAGYLFVGAHLLSGVVMLAIVAYIWRHKRHRPGAWEWIVVLLLITGSTWSYGIALVTWDRPVRIALEVVTMLSVLWVAIAFLGFALAYTGQEHLLDGRLFTALVAAGLVVTGLAATNHWHQLLYAAARFDPTAGMAGARYVRQPLLVGITAGVFLIGGLAGLQLAGVVSGFDQEFRRHVYAMAATPVLPMLAGVSWAFQLGPYPALNLLPISFFPNALANVYVLFHRDILEVPAGLHRTGRRAAIDDLGTPVITAGADGRIVDLNAPAEDLFDVRSDEVRSEDLDVLIGTGIDLDEPEQRIDVTDAGDRRTYKLTNTPFESEGGSHRGYTVTVQDVTDEIQRKQRLEVLNRILRHNLRNELNVVELEVDRLRDSVSDPDHRRQLRRIQDVTVELMELGEKARYATDTLGTAEMERIPVRPFLETVVQDVRLAYQDVTVELDGVVDRPVQTNADVLGLVVRSILENAIEHNDAAEPRVTIGLEPSDEFPDAVVLTVTDNGPGIPEHERAVIEDGEETDLRHGSGIGLWLIHWGTTLLGGNVEFTVDERGTTVAIRLPAGEDDRSAQSPPAA